MSAALLPTTAAAQVPQPHLYAGGSVSGVFGIRPGDSEIGIRVVPGGKVIVRAAAVARCRNGNSDEVAGRGVGRIDFDGSFRLRLTQSTQLQAPGSRSAAVVRGRIEGARARGVIAVSVRPSNRRAGGCRAITRWVATNAPTVGADAAPAPAGATLVGMSSKTRLGGPFGVNLRVSRDGRRVTKVIASARMGCARLRDFEETNYAPPATIRPDGSFRRNELIQFKSRDEVTIARVLTRGRFVTGGARGTYRMVVVTVSRRTKRITDRCDSGLVRWFAAPA
ncbi:MAG TPA: hypothetical protein VGW75_08220 [Solirubrobacteraceae bacterium]|nr:hypothetical protein [Solirubrobacteraceae bacterium]